MAGTITYWANVNTTDGTISGTGHTTPQDDGLPFGVQIISADQFATIEAAIQDGVRCKMVSGVVRIMPLPTPTPVLLADIKAHAYVAIDTDAETARAEFLTPGSGQALEYQQTAADALRLLNTLGLTIGPTRGAISVTTAPPRAGPEIPATATAATIAAAVATMIAADRAAIDPADYPWIASEQAALASIGHSVPLDMVALGVMQTMRGWDTAGAAIKRIRREAKLQVWVATTPDEISAVLSGLSWPKPPADTRF